MPPVLICRLPVFRLLRVTLPGEQRGARHVDPVDDLYPLFGDCSETQSLDEPTAGVVVDGDMALLTYNLVNYIRDAKGVESVGSRWNSTTVYRRRGDTWKAIHSHWSFTRHPAFQDMTPEASEGLEA